MSGWPLEDGEALLWEGRPGSEFSLAPVAGTVRQMGWLFAGLAVLVAGLTGFVEPDAVVVVFLGMGALGLGVILVIGWVNQRKRANRDYAVTDRRALVRYRSRPTHGQAFTPFDPDAIKLRPGPTPSVLVGSGPLIYTGSAGGTLVTHQDYVVEMIEEAEVVAGYLRAAATRNGRDRDTALGITRFSAECHTWSLPPS